MISLFTVARNWVFITLKKVNMRCQHHNRILFPITASFQTFRRLSTLLFLYSLVILSMQWHLIITRYTKFPVIKTVNQWVINSCWLWHHFGSNDATKLTNDNAVLEYDVDKRLASLIFSDVSLYASRRNFPISKCCRIPKVVSWEFLQELFDSENSESNCNARVYI